MTPAPSYKPVTQLPYHCVPACLMMILDRRNIKHGSQQEIGYELGLIVPAEEAHKFEKVRTGEKPIAGYGTQVAKKQFSINHFFKKSSIELKESYFPPEKIDDYAKFITNSIGESNDLIVCFNNKSLFGSGDWGHTCVIQGLEGSVVTLIDPAIGEPKKRKVSLSDLISAIEKHGKSRRAGFWVISYRAPMN